jgi:ubiquinone/menaquinone biosynthesis C-methylase UbiE
VAVQKDPEGSETRYLLRLAEFGGSTSQRVLEIGCGDGRLTWRYANAAAQVIGIDLHADDLRVAMADRPNNLADKVNLARADAIHLPFANASFDLSIFAWSF